MFGNSKLTQSKACVIKMDVENFHVVISVLIFAFVLSWLNFVNAKADKNGTGVLIVCKTILVI